MKQMKKLLALLLALMMVLALAACGSKQDEVADEPQSEEQTENQVENQEEEKPFEAGTVEGNTYTNETLGLTLTLDENWAFLDDEQIGELTGMVQNMSDSEALQDALEGGASLFDVYAMTNDLSGRNINITVSDLGALFGGLTSEDAYAAAMAEQLKPTFESMGAENVEIETTTCMLAGAEHSGVHVNVDMQGAKLCESLTCVKVGKLVYNITCVAQSEEELTAVMEMFQAL